MYNSIADEFHRSRNRPWSDFDFFTPYLKADATILDVGCGNGRLLDYLKKPAFESYLGIDISEELLKHARSTHLQKNVQFRPGDILNLPVANQSYDAVFSIAVLHHIPSQELQREALQELYRVMKPDGKLYLSVWDLYQWRYFGYFVKAFFRSLFTGGNYAWNDLKIPWGKKQKTMRFCHAFKPKELAHLLLESGFEILDLKSSGKGNHLIVARPFLGARQVKILGIEFDGVTLKEATSVIAGFLKSPRQHYVVTPNPEILLHAQKSPSYREILNQASLKVADGIGILWAARYVLPHRYRLSRLIAGVWGLIMLLIRPQALRSPLPERVTGVDLVETLCHQSHRLEAKIFLLGARPGVAEAVAKKWRFDQIVGVYAGSPKPKDEEEILQRIHSSRANLLFVAYGAPQQEEWIARNLPRLPYIKVAMGVGGAFDFIAGRQQRAPQWMQKLGLEWLWRLLQEPKRIKRIFNATIRFPIRTIFS